MWAMIVGQPSGDCLEMVINELYMHGNFIRYYGSGRKHIRLRGK